MINANRNLSFFHFFCQLMVALMGGFARIGNNEVIILGNDAEITDIDPQEAQQALEIIEANLSRVEGKRQAIEVNLALR